MVSLERKIFQLGFLIKDFLEICLELNHTPHPNFQLFLMIKGLKSEG